MAEVIAQKQITLDSGESYRIRYNDDDTFDVKVGTRAVYILTDADATSVAQIFEAMRRIQQAHTGLKNIGEPEE